MLRGAKCRKDLSEIQAALNLGVTTLRQNGGFIIIIIVFISTQDKKYISYVTIFE